MMKKNKNAAASPVGDTKTKAIAFVNWAIPIKDDKELKSDKGFPLFQNPEYPNPKEDLLIALAKKHGGSVTINMVATIRLNGGTPSDIDLDDIPTIPVG